MLFSRFKEIDKKKYSDINRKADQVRQMSQQSEWKQEKEKQVPKTNMDSVKIKRQLFSEFVPHQPTKKDQCMKQTQNIEPKPTNRRSSIEEIQSEFRKMLLKMTEKQKLFSIEELVNEAKSLKQKFGYFYVTCAMVVFKPANNIKLSLWIHPNLKNKDVLHPIMKENYSEKETEFYKSLKYVLHQIFPTINLGNNFTYEAICSRIFSLQNQILKRIYSSCPSDVGKKNKEPMKSFIFHKQLKNIQKQKEIIKRNEKKRSLIPPNHFSQPNKSQEKQLRDLITSEKTYLDISSKDKSDFIIGEKSLEISFNEQMKKLFGDISSQSFTLYDQSSNLDSSRNHLFQDIRGEFGKILL